MGFGDLIGSIGVALLLLAFGLNLARVLPAESKAYAALNALGAGLACWASWMIGFMPFVVLEGTWCLAALYALGRRPASAESATVPTPQEISQDPLSDQSAGESR